MIDVRHVVTTNMKHFLRFVYVLEENFWCVFMLIAVCFCWFSYSDWLDKRRKRNEHSGNGNLHKSQDGSDTEDHPRNEDNNRLDSALDDDLEHVPFSPAEYSDGVMVSRSEEFYETMSRRRTVRFFRNEKIPDDVIRNIIKIAGTSPSGAHTEPWSFVAVKDTDTKQAIREIVEDEERINYERRMSRQWTADLRPLKTNWSKPYLTEAPVLILVFRQIHSTRPGGQLKNHYYSEISVAIAAGLLIAAIQVAGLVTLTSTPLNCGPRLRVLLSRPSNEKLMLLFPIGRASKSCTVPALKRKQYEDICSEI